MNQQPVTHQSIILRIRRQERPEAPSRWEECAVPYRPNMNIITTCLQNIAANPTTTDGTRTTPVVFESSCLEEVCGSCTMLINGKTRQACSALVDKLEPTCPRQKRDRNSLVYNPVDYGNPPAVQGHSGHHLQGPITLEPLSKIPVVRDLWVDRQR